MPPIIFKSNIRGNKRHGSKSATQVEKSKFHHLEKLILSCTLQLKHSLKGHQVESKPS